MIVGITAKAEQELGSSCLYRRSGSFALVITSFASSFSSEKFFFFLFFFLTEDGEGNIQIAHNKWNTEKEPAVLADVTIQPKVLLYFLSS